MSDRLSDYAVMLSHAKIIEDLGGGTEVAVALSADLGQSIDRETVYKWRERDLIPPRYWPAVERLAKLRDIETITVETLECAA